MGFIASPLEKTDTSLHYPPPPPKKKKWDKKKKQWHLSFTPPKTNMTMEKTTMNEDVSPIKNGDFPLPMLIFRGVWEN